MEGVIRVHLLISAALAQISDRLQICFFFFLGGGGWFDDWIPDVDEIISAELDCNFIRASLIFWSAAWRDGLMGNDGSDSGGRSLRGEKERWWRVCSPVCCKMSQKSVVDF